VASGEHERRWLEQVITDRYHASRAAVGAGLPAMGQPGRHRRPPLPERRTLVPAYRPWAREDVRDSLSACLGCAMSEFVRFTLDDGSEVMFESAESDLVALRGGPPDIRDGGRLT
jgi:hypothetical protein